MRKQAETFHTNKGYKLEIEVSKPISPFSKYKFVIQYSKLFARKRGLRQPYFLYENESLQHRLSYDMSQMEKFSVRLVIF